MGKARKPGQSYLDEELIEAVKIYQQCDGNQTKAARTAGVPRPTFQSRLHAAEMRGFLVINRNIELAKDHEPELILPELLPSELPAKELIRQASERFKQHKAARESKRWFEVPSKTNNPIGICFMGDPHIDSPGCNWPLLERDIALLEQTPGMYAVNIGDLTDNWVGRLERLYANSEMTKKQGWKLAKYLLRDCKINWLAILLGNHDSWNDGEAIIKSNAPKIVPVEDWQARFQIVFKNGQRVRIHAAHDFPGTSIWNIQHGPQRAAMMWEDADIFACGHKHQWACTESEHSHRNFIYWLVRSRGYKHFDEYADRLGYGAQNYGASITAVIDPSVEVGPKRLRCFPDLEEAAEFLTWKRRML